MPKYSRMKYLFLNFLLTLFFIGVTSGAHAEIKTIDRIELATQQITMLKNRLKQAEHELTHLEQEHDQQISQLMLEKASKNLLDKASLDISVSKSNLDSINIELIDAQQTANWLEKNVQEIENQLNVMSMFGLKTEQDETMNAEELHSDLLYQQKLLTLEKVRVQYLESLQNTSKNVVQFKKEKQNRIDNLLKSRNMLHIKQQQMKDELIYQEQQNQWLQVLNRLYEQLAKTDPLKSKEAYSSLERDIFYANESANHAYVQSVVARYKDQIQQMKLSLLRSNSISLLNEISDQAQSLTKQIDRLEIIIKARTSILDKHITYLSRKRGHDAVIKNYLTKLTVLNNLYQSVNINLVELNHTLFAFRTGLDQALQNELSARQGFPTFGIKTLLDLGKEILLVPALTFQIVKNLSLYLMRAIYSMSILGWSLFFLVEGILIAGFAFLYRFLARFLDRPSTWRDQINSKWLSLQWLKRNYLDLVVAGQIIGILFFLHVPFKNYVFIIYLSLVWLLFKGMMTIASLCLLETMHHTAGHDVKLYRRLKWMMIVSGIIIALTVFIHQLPLIYELKMLCDQLFLLFLMIASLLLLRSWEVIPNLILSQMESQHSYLKNSIRLIGILIPLLILVNSVIGLLGFMNLVKTISWYEGVFLLVLIGYLVLRGALSDAMEQLSRLMIQYVHNGWLWTEAFLKPIDNVLRITLFLVAWAVLFILYGWDKQSPIVERLTRLLHYQLASVLDTTITPLSMIELFIVISIFYWTAKWTREFIYRLLSSHTKDMGIRNTIAILSQYSVIILGTFFCLRVLGINLQALAIVASVLAFGVGLGLRDLVNNFACGFLILLERPLRVGDIVNINETEGEVIHIGSRAVTIRTSDNMELLVPNAEIFNKSFTNWTAKDNIVRTVTSIKISRYDNPHEVKVILQMVLAEHKEVLKDPVPEVFLKEMNETLMQFEIRYFVNIRQVKSRVSAMSSVLLCVWDAFAKHNIKPPYPQHEIFLRNDEIKGISFEENMGSNN